VQRFLVDDTYARDGAALFFFCGNEGPIDEFANFSRWVPELARDLNAHVVYAEHRFYGESLPFGASSLQPNQTQTLSVEQAMQDYAALITHLTAPGSRLHGAKVVTFGGSYGGMLSSWMRAHYPHLVFASVASSAPVRFDRIGPSFFPLTTAAAAAMVPSCPGLVRAGFQALLASPLPQVVEAFGLCPGAAPHRATLTLWARNAFVTAAMGNYPYRSDLFGKGLSAWPLRVACEALELGEAPALERLARALNTYYNASGTVACHMVPEEYRSCADQTGCGSGTSLWGQAWDHEVCTQIVYFTSTNNVTDMFPPRQWSLTQLQAYCRAVWGVQPEPEWYQHLWEEIKASSRIIFTYGEIDPWRGGGVAANLSETLVVVHIPEAAHIYDLAGSHPNDTKAMTTARQQVASLLGSWLN